MESLTVSVLFLLLCLSLFFPRRLLLPNYAGKKPKPVCLLPPAASPLRFLTHIFRGRSLFELAFIIRHFHSLYGPIFSLRLFPFSPPSVFISDASLAHSALVHNGAIFADRPLAVEPSRLINAGDASISSAPYGSLWRILRRNLSSQILHPSRIRLFAPARNWAVGCLLHSLTSHSGQAFAVRESFQFSIFSLLVFMCFGVKLGEREIREIELTQAFLLRTFTSFNVFAVVPSITKVLFRKRWRNIVDVHRRQAEVFLPLIRARQKRKNCSEEEQKGFEYCYVDSLLDMKLTGNGGQGLTDDEIVSLCHEFLSGGVDTTTTALEWTMAELVLNQEVQSKLVSEIESLERNAEEEIIREEDLQEMPYLKAVVLESLRRHPPGHFVLPHAVTEDVALEGFLIPKGSQVHFAVADVNMDSKIWEEPMEFRPERFFAGGGSDQVDITGSREIKMMPFGAGRRICPGYGLAMLHLEFFVANLVREFEWKAGTGEEVDLSYKLEFTSVMKNPLSAQLFPRRKK